MNTLSTYDRYRLFDTNDNSTIRTFCDEQEIVQHFKNALDTQQILNMFLYERMHEFTNDASLLSKLQEVTKRVITECVAKKLMENNR